MGKLPNHNRAVIPIEKLLYSLDPMHPTGRHKARVFRSALGFGLESIGVLEGMLRDGIATHEAEKLPSRADGIERWMVEWIVIGRLGPLRMVSAWGQGRKDRVPRLLSCYLKQVKT